MHIGFIMDGNRRWATARNLAKHLGHHQGTETFNKIVRLCVDNDIPYMSFWALAKKNILERSPAELSYLYKLFEETLTKMAPLLHEKKIQFQTIGDLSLLPDNIKVAAENLIQDTQSYTDFTLVLAIGYGGQDEIVRATKRAIESGIDPKDLNEQSFTQFLDCGRFPPPDLIVRTGGDTRHSGYFLYQAEYSEYYFSDTLWPDFSEGEFYTALKSLKNAKRNFGK